ncbi:Mov34/MPN/PAD-1 family protein [Yersinia enterocolitica]|uniref:Mov34/MPN/PAD-1 family protein n=1 Tax=Yersinia enterocolitica TaxID=630 RepID=UPI0028760D8E|nr:Mov34/MPN/PAD-1 family protein [Yersinia enterocolitica]HDL6932802.1 Mov34/MPN/PAD-1 family protein [Yersinia enterocolitica]HDW8046042.1 Mov34/MPN/PAD-1 family protein [Yersinia enterocolitica]
MHRFHCIELDFKICISQSIIDELFSHRQNHCFSKESGGMLFSNNLNDSEIEINKITTPSPSDLRKRNFFKLNEKKANEDIISFFEDGFHYLGDWHTHNEAVATPSGTDIRSIQDLFIKSGHTRPFFLMLIISNKENISNCYLAAADRNKLYEFKHQTINESDINK